jgi:hypothetical protein
LRALEDEAIRDAIRRQIDLGLDVITDGEFRRWMFLNSFYDAVEGFRTDNVVTFRNARGEDVPPARPRARRSSPPRRLVRRTGGRVHERGRRRVPIQDHVPGTLAVSGTRSRTSPA